MAGHVLWEMFSHLCMVDADLDAPVLTSAIRRVPLSVAGDYPYPNTRLPFTTTGSLGE